MSPASTTAWTPDSEQGRPLWEALGFGAGASGRPVGAITVVGAGGKTTLVHALATAAAESGARVLLTTTTKMVNEPGLITDPDEALAALEASGAGEVVLAGAASGPEKFGAFPPEAIDALRAASDVVVVEGDGARRLPFKVPADHEPVVPEWTDLLVVVAGLSALGRPLDEVCCRAELAAGLLSRQEAAGVPTDPHRVADAESGILDPGTAAALLRAGYLDIPRLARWTDRRVVVLNQADDPGRRALGRVLASALPGECVLLTTTIQQARNQR